MNYKEIKSYEDACKALNIEPLADEVFNALPKAERENVKAYHQLTVITRAINGGWEPDFSNREQRKYEPYMYTDNAGLACAPTLYAPSYTFTYVGSRLCFPDYERAEFAVKTFYDTYKAFFLPGKWEDEAQEQAPGAAEKEPEEKKADGSDNVERHIDDLSDAPDFLQKVGDIVMKQIQPLQEQDMDNQGFIIIAIQDKAEDKDGDTGMACTFAEAGAESTLSKGLAQFLKHDKSQDIIKRAFLRILSLGSW